MKKKRNEDAFIFAGMQMIAAVFTSDVMHSEKYGAKGVSTRTNL